MEKQVCLVEIISCDVPTAWYASLVGHRFECYEWGKDYVLKQDYDAGDQHWWRHITKDNCVVVNAAEHHAHLTGGGLCAQCGSPAWTHSVRDHAFVEPHHPQVA